MLSINTNLSSLIAQRAMQTSTDRLNQAVERMSTGFKINHAKDNAANYSISTNLTTKINAYQIAEDNVAMGMDMLTTADENLSLISDKLIRLRDLATQASNGTYGTNSLNAINAEANALVDEINRLYTTAEYNGRNLFGLVESERTIEERFIVDFVRQDTTNMTPLSTITDESQILASDTYSISTVDELKKLARLVNEGKLGSFNPDDGTINSYGTYEFVLANDIDLSSVENWTPIGGVPTEDTNGDGVIDVSDDVNGFFTGTFDGNGYVISNLNISVVYMFAGLFGITAEATIKNLAVEDASITNRGTYTGVIASEALNTTIDNCYTSGIIRNTHRGSFSAGILAMGQECIVSNSYSEVNGELLEKDYSSISGIAYVLQDALGNPQKPTNCFYAGKIIGNLDDDSFMIAPISYTNTPITDCYYVNDWTSEENIEIMNNAWGGNADFVGISKTKSEIEQIFGVKLSRTEIATFDFQIGIYSDDTSNLSLKFGVELSNIDALRNIGVDKTIDFLTQLDDMLTTVNEKQVEYGSAQNRLESALDEISTQYENLVSSRSTLRDADIAEVSAEYIQQQILQQAAATLMSTANQSPAIALQLI